MTDLRHYDGFVDAPAFVFLSGDTGTGLTAAGRRLDTLSEELTRARAVTLPSASIGVTATAAAGAIAEMGRGVDHAAEQHLRAGAAFDELNHAARDYLKNSPTDAEITAGWAAVAAARKALMDADDAHRTAAGAARKAASDRLADLLERRDAAVAAFDRAAERIQSRLGVHRKEPHGVREQDRGTGVKMPGGKPNPAAPAPAPAPAPSPAARSAAALPGTAPAPAAAPSPSSAGSSGNEAAIAALMADQRRGGQPVQIPQAQPQQAPAAPAPTVSAPPPPQLGGGSNPKQDKGEAVTSEDLDRAIGSTPAAVPVLGPAAGITPTSPASPATTPAAAAAPATTGTSVAGLHTDAQVSGRSEGPRTALAAGTPENATRVAPQANPSGPNAAGQPMGQGMPMMPGMGGSGAPSRKQNALVTTYTPESAEAHGHTTISEAVRGGTIAQNRPGSDE